MFYIPLFINILLCYGSVGYSSTFSAAFFFDFSIWIKVFTWLYIEDDIKVFRPESYGASPNIPNILLKWCKFTLVYKPESNKESVFFYALGLASGSTTNFLCFLVFFFFYFLFIFFYFFEISSKILFYFFSVVKIPASPLPPWDILITYYFINSLYLSNFFISGVKYST